MKVSLNRIEKDFHFEAKGASRVPIHIDTTLDGPSKGASPMELLLMGIAGCNAIDVVNILNKQKQEISSYKIEVEGNRKKVEAAMPFGSALHNIIFDRNINPTYAMRIVTLIIQYYLLSSIHNNVNMN